MKKKSLISVLLLMVLLVCLSGCNSTPKETPTESSVKEVSESNQTNTGKRVYLAGPLFSQAEREYNLKISEILESYGYDVFLPQRDGVLATELVGLTGEEKVAKIFEIDKNEVLKSDIVFVILDGRVPDEGACIELGLGYAYGKRCYGFKSDFRSIESDIDINPMIAGCLQKIFYNVDGEKLLEDLKTYLDNNQL